MPASVPAIDSGTVTPAATIGISRRMNTKITSSTRATVISRVYWMSSTLARIVLVRSEITVILMSGEIHDFSSGRMARMPSTVSMTLAPAALLMVSRMAGCLPSHAASRTLATPSITEATLDNPHDGAVDGLQHQRRVLRGVRDLAVDGDGLGVLRPLETAHRLRDVGGAHGVVDVLAGETHGGQRHRIEADAHGGLFRAVDLHLRHPVHLRQPLPQDAVGGVEKLGGRQGVGGQREGHDRRIGRIEFPVVGPGRQVGRQVGGGGVDRRLHVVGGAVDVPVDVELHDDRGRADRADRGDFVDPGDLAEVALQRRRNRARHGLRPGTRPRGEHDDGRECPCSAAPPPAGTDRPPPRQSATPARAAGWRPGEG